MLLHDYKQVVVSNSSHQCQALYKEYKKVKYQLTHSWASVLVC